MKNKLEIRKYGDEIDEIITKNFHLEMMDNNELCIIINKPETRIFISSKNKLYVNVIEENGSISDELDYALMKYLLQNRGTGFTPCQPQLVEFEDGKKALKLSIDNTFVGKDNQLMGLGIVGIIYVDMEKFNVLYATSKEELEINIKKLEEAGVKPQPRPHGKY